MLAPEVVAALAPLPGIAELLRFMLVRDARRRPTIPEVLQRCARVWIPQPIRVAHAEAKVPQHHSSTCTSFVEQQADASLSDATDDIGYGPCPSSTVHSSSPVSAFSGYASVEDGLRGLSFKGGFV